ncbi:carbohydrate degradation protein [Enterovibrio norvegicus FF-454]|uniref:Carbohydrate degradation protein n=1 Tax=Enterovibrio norvegicus FF-454 TaxID=1185651 RepID=A0A1E5BYX6_9GAMM|nr:transketolase [Enterovibrio norvegicus]OEE58457.1 carbohydrate degradation protein [Enterovibrio norvegicus FF-454]
MQSSLDLRQIESFNLSIKKEMATALLNMGYGHFGGCLSVTETLACLYGRYLKHDPANPQMKDRDLFVLSKGHAGPALYATLALRGFFDISWLKTINANGTNLPSHADMQKTPGVDMTTGSLGQGISCATGMAAGSDSNVFTIVGDGELQEGQCWEAIQFAAHHKLSNLVVFVDNNKRQLDGDINDIQASFDLQKKFESFGFQSLPVDGGNVEAICLVIEQAIATNDRPTAIILDTEKGQGMQSVVSISANHHLRLDDNLRAAIEADIALLDAKIEELK